MICNRDCFNCKFTDCIRGDHTGRRMSEEAKRKWAAYMKQYRAEHKEKLREYHRKYYLAHRETILARTKAWIQAKKEKGE